MAFGYTGGATAGGSSTSAAVTHGQSISAGDLVVCYLNYNHESAAITPSETWETPSVETPAGETAQQAMYWKIAGTEPSAYTFTLATDTRWRLSVQVFTSATDAEVDSAFATAMAGSAETNLVCGAISGATLSDNCLSIIAGGKDTFGGATTYTTADNSYLSVVGDTDDQASAIAYRIWGASPSAPSAVTISTDSKSDKTYSTHISFVEAVGGGVTGKSNPLSGCLGGPLAGPLG